MQLPVASHMTGTASRFADARVGWRGAIAFAQWGKTHISTFVLLFLNIAMAISQVLAGPDDHSSKQVAELELYPEKLKIIRVGEVRQGEEAHASVISEHPTSLEKQAGSRACLEWSGILPKDADRLRVLLSSYEATYTLVAVKSPEQHWVYIPGIKTAEAAEDISAQLRASGERGYAVMRPDAQGTYQISLGVFRSEDGARRQHERFLRLGAVLTPHGAERTLYIVEGTLSTIGRIAAAASDFPQTTVKAVECPARTG